MSKDKDIEDEQGSGNSCNCDGKMGGRNDVLAAGSDNGFVVCSNCPPPRKKGLTDVYQALSLLNDSATNSTDVEEPQDADYSYVPSLSDELALILARVPRSEYWKLSFVNKRFLGLLKSGELYRVRNEIGVKESAVFMLAIGESCWWTFDREFNSCRMLPALPSDFCFTNGDKESLCAGNQLIVTGNEFHGAALWRYELLTNKWCRGPSMIYPRCMFASASCGTFAFVAGGISLGSDAEILNSAEKYDPESKSWSPLPPMNRRRKCCSGCYIDRKFYVIGGLNEHGQNLTCGEAFDEAKSKWELIPDMLRDIPVLTSQSPPLIAVANNALFSIESSSNQLMVYLKKSNSWKKLGQVPVSADSTRGWGVAFKSLGDELLVMGAPKNSGAYRGMAIYTCLPVPDAELEWRRLDYGRAQRNHFILNCSVMVA